MQKILLLLAITAATLLHCNGQEMSNCSRMCEGHLANKSLSSVDNLTELADMFEGCQYVSGSIIINLLEESDLTNEDLSFLSCLEVIDGVLSFENMELAEQIVIPNLWRIEGNKMIADTNTSLRVVNVSGGDIIFPSLLSITSGNAEFDISSSDECGYLGINWTLILSAGELVNQSTDCMEPDCSNCSSKYCWSDSYCQASPQGDDDDDPFYIELWNDHRTWVIAGGAGVVAILLLLIICCCCCCCCCCCRRRRRKNYSTSMKAVGITDTIDAGVHKYNSFILTELPSVNLEAEPVDPPKQHKIVVLESDHFELAQLLGNGSCGQVYKGYWHTDVNAVSYLVAIKVFATPSANYKQLVEEKLQKFTGLEHENVMRLCSVSYRSQLMLAYEFAPIGLRQYVIQNKLMLSALDLITMATHIAKGVAYLTSKGIPHGNLAARNVMVCQSNIAKVTDYNLYDLTTKSDWLPIRWLAPETLKYRKHNEKSDMWSYGVTVWEMLTFGAHPYHGKPTEDMLKSLENGQRLQQPVTVTADLYSILVECWWIDPMMRPSFGKMVKTMATCQSNPSQYVLTMVDGKLDTYLKLPPAATDANPYENLADINEAGYLLMMSHVPSSPANHLDPPRSRGEHSASINSDNIINGQMAAASFMSADVRVQDERYSPVPAKPVTQDEIYVNSQPDDIYDDVIKSSEQQYEDEMYTNPEMTEGDMYEIMERKDTPGGQVTEMYIIPTTDVTDFECASPEKTKSQTDQPHADPELQQNEESIYEDTLVDERGYEKMKTGVSINDINAEYVYAVKQDETLEQTELYEVPDPDGYENAPNKLSQSNIAKPPQSKQPQSKQPEEDEYLLLGQKSALEESQIYSSVQ